MAILLDVLAAGVIDNSGAPLDSGVVYVYEVGTTTKVNVFQDADLSVLHSNPLTLSAAGKAEAYVENSVRLVIESSLGAQIADIDSSGELSALSGDVTLGTTPSNTLDIRSSLISSIIPKDDDTYDIGSSTHKWAEGHFGSVIVYNDLTISDDASVLGDVEIDGSLQANGNVTLGDSVSDTVSILGAVIGDFLKAIGSNTPGWISNLGLTYSGGTLTITDASGAALSSSNPGYVCVPSTTAGLFKILKITSSALTVKDDANASSQFTNFGFGITETVDWAQDVPFFLYAVNRGNTDINGSDGNSALFLARSPTLSSTPSSANSIGDQAAVAVTDDKNSISMLGTYTKANYISLPCQIIGAVRMRWSTGTDDWTIQALSNKDGLGQSQLNKTFSTVWTMPAGQNGATSGKYFVNNGGTAPTFTSNDYFYYMSSTGMIHLTINFGGDGGVDGAGAVNMLMALPVSNVEETTSARYTGTVDVGLPSGAEFIAHVSSGGADDFVSFLRATVSGSALQNGTTVLTNAEFAAMTVTTNLVGSIVYKAF